LDYAKTVKDSDLTLGDIWTKDFEDNAARGEYQNDELHYDLGGRFIFDNLQENQVADIKANSWIIHIS